jgi:hypothetical protein
MNGLASIRHANKRFDLTRTGRALQSRAKGAQVKRKHVRQAAGSVAVLKRWAVAILVGFVVVAAGYGLTALPFAPVSAGLAVMPLFPGLILGLLGVESEWVGLLVVPVSWIVWTLITYAVLTIKGRNSTA